MRAYVKRFHFMAVYTGNTYILAMFTWKMHIIHTLFLLFGCCWVFFLFLFRRRQASYAIKGLWRSPSMAFVKIILIYTAFWMRIRFKFQKYQRCLNIFYFSYLHTNNSIVYSTFMTTNRNNNISLIWYFNYWNAVLLVCLRNTKMV